MGPINLDVLDPADLEQIQFGDDAKRWLTNIVDIINASFSSLNNALGNLLAVGQIDVGGAGAGPIAVTVTGLMTGNYVAAQVVSSSNPVTVLSAVAGAGSFNITFSGNPGASAVIVYQAFTKQPQ